MGVLKLQSGAVPSDSTGGAVGSGSRMLIQEGFNVNGCGGGDGKGL